MMPFDRFAPKSAIYLLTTLNDRLSNARRFVASLPLRTVDGGAGGDFTVSVDGASANARGVVRLPGQQLGGTADAPDVRGIRATGGAPSSGPVLLPFGNIADGQVLARVNGSVIGVDVVTAPGGVGDSNLDMGGHTIGNLGNASTPDQAVTLGQVGGMLNGLEWQASVINQQPNPPGGTPGMGERFLVGPSPGGAWTGHANTIATWKGSWDYLMPGVGWTVHLDNGGRNLNFNGSAWIDIGTSIDHNSLLGLTTGNPHTQYQLGGEKNQVNGYAGLDGNGLVTSPVKAIRSGGDPGSPGQGEVWINGINLKYQNSGGGGGQTEIVERMAMKDQNNGYAGLDGGGMVNRAVKAVRVGGDPGSPNPGEVWINGGLLKFRDASGSPQTQIAVTTIGGSVPTDLDMGGHRFTNVADANAPNQAATLGQVGAMMNGLEWRNSVVDKGNDPPGGTPGMGDQFLVGTSPTGAWGGHANAIATWKGSWFFDAPNIGWTVHVDSGGHDYHFNGSAWVDIGASIDHNSLLGLTTGNPHTQYQLGSEKNQSNGYPSLDGNGMVANPVKAVRFGGDPGSPGSGAIWINGDVLKYQDATGSPQTQFVEVGSRKDQNNGYAGLDGGGLVNRPVKAVRVGGDPGSPNPGEVWVNGVVLKFRDAGGSPVTRELLATLGGTLPYDLDMGGHKLTNLADATAPNHALTLGQAAAMINGLEWQDSVVDKANDPPGSPGMGDRFLVGTSATGAWSGHDNGIATWKGSWAFIAPNTGWTVHVDTGGHDYHFNGSAWVDIGASIDHNSLLGLTTGNPHTQYQLGSEKDADGGYAGLDGDGVMNSPVRRVRVVGSDGSPSPGDVWVNGAVMKFRDNSGTPVTRVVAPAGRAVNHGTGLTGGGDLTADRTIEIAAFTGLVSKDYDVGGEDGALTWTGTDEVIVHASFDIGTDGHFVLMGVRLPDPVDADLETEVKIEFHDASTPVVIAHASEGAPLDKNMQELADLLLGVAGGSATNNGRSIKKITFQTKKPGAGAVSDVTLGAFQLRAFGFARGSGSAL